MTRFSAQSARAFAAYYVRLIYYFQSTGDGRALVANSATGCLGCKQIIGRISSTYKAGGYIREANYDRRKLTIDQFALSSVPGATVNITASEGTVTHMTKRGGPLQRYTAGNTRWELLLIRHPRNPGAWICDEVTWE